MLERTVPYASCVRLRGDGHHHEQQQRERRASRPSPRASYTPQEQQVRRHRQREQRRRGAPDGVRRGWPRRAREGSRTLRSGGRRGRGGRGRCPRSPIVFVAAASVADPPLTASSANGAIVPTASGSKAFVFVFGSTARPGPRQDRDRTPRVPAEVAGLRPDRGGAEPAADTASAARMSPLAVKSDRPSFRISDEFGRSRRDLRHFEVLRIFSTERSTADAFYFTARRAPLRGWRRGRWQRRTY